MSRPWRDLPGGEVQILFAAAPGTVDCIKAEKLRALAVSGPSQADVLRDRPTIAGTLPGYEASQWYGLAAPARMPADIVERLNREINAVLPTPQ
jgi:tripartite-type tricarboxylate transporter receptor subunit TctC